jgi:hypothetical protein
MKSTALLSTLIITLGIAFVRPSMAQTSAVKSTFVRLGPGVPAVLYEPLTPGPKADIGVFVMHSSGDYLQFSACTELSARGYRVLCANNTNNKAGTENDLSIDRVLLDAKLGVAWLRKYPAVRKVVLLGHSGGGVLMSSYQAIAEGGLKACQGPEKIVKCNNNLADLPPADGLMLIDSNYGMSAMTLFSIDPAVIDEGSGQTIDPKLDLYNPQNGFDPNGAKYSAEFTRRFQTAVGKRENRLIRMALDRLQKINLGQGRFNDDEPFVIPGANYNGFNNKFFAQDTRFLSRTRKAWPLLHKDGALTTEIVHTVRVPENTNSTTPSMERGALKTTVRKFLGTFAVRVGDDFAFDENSIRGVAWTSSYTTPAASVQNVKVPLLTMGMTGHWEYLAAEIIYENASSADKSIAFVEGATHGYSTCTKCEKTPGQYGDTLKTTYDYIDSWLAKPARFSAAAQPVASAAPSKCASLATMALPDTAITTAEEVTDGSLAPRGSMRLTGLPPFCRVAAVTKPAVKFEVWLPLANWNGKFQGVGNGANAGSISYAAMATALKRGYATASTDTGHETGNARDASWALGAPELVSDFGYRAIHVTAVNAKQIVERFYAEPAKHSYFFACSTGGRQGLMEAQRFPEDYDGIIAGAPAANWSHFQTGGHMWVASALNKDPQSYLPATKLRLLGDAVNAACDRLDGIADGVIADPRKCSFNPKALQCAAGKDDATCLTPKQVKAVSDIWSGAYTARGALIYPGYMRGAEAAPGGWDTTMTGEGPLSGTHWDQAVNVLKYMVFEKPDWDFQSFNVERDAAFAETKLGKTFDAFDPDLTRFRDRGGRLILYHGWNDPSISPLNTVNYYEKVIASLGRNGSAQQAQARAQEFARLFMVPGMLHCGGGPGPNSFDLLTSLEQWVEQQRPPERIIASHSTSGAVDRTRPLCAYPKVASYSGSGSTDDAANFVCHDDK